MAPRVLTLIAIASLALAQAGLTARAEMAAAAPEVTQQVAAPETRRELSDEESEEAQVLVTMADAVAKGKPSGGDAFLRWTGHFLKRADDLTYVPFTIELDEAPDGFRTAAMYVRVAERGDTRGMAERVEEKEREVQPGDTVPVSVPERQFLPPGTPTAGEAAAALTLAERGDPEAAVYPFEDFHFLELPEGQGGEPRIVRRALAVPAGSYDLYVALRERPSRDDAPLKGAVLKTPLDVPNYSGRGLATSSIILADSIEPLAGPLEPEEQAERPYALGGAEILPERDTVFARDEMLTVAFLVYDAGVDGSGKPDVTVSYEFYQQGGGPERFFNRTPPQQYSPATLPEVFDLQAGHQLAPIQEVPLSSFPAGGYRLEVTLIDAIADATQTLSVRFVVEE